jgi:hypothetical protein
VERYVELLKSFIALMGWKILVESVGVCRGVLRVWGMRIQDSRTDFLSKTRDFGDFTSTRGWCKIETCDAGILRGEH